MSDLSELLRAAEKLGIQPRIANAIDFARTNQVVLLRHISSAANIDISLGILP